MFLTFGEVMARIAPPGRRRWRQALPGSVEVTWGGGEANVASSLALLGQPVRYLTALPDQPVARSLESTLRGLGVDTGSIVWQDGGRLGLYFVEVGANQRGSTVLYDRADSVVSQAGSDAYDFPAALTDVHWVHLTGITPAISQAACEANLELARLAKHHGAMVSCDLNFRKKLWRWDPSRAPRVLAQATMSQLLPYVDVVIGNEEDAADVLGIEAGHSNVESGALDIDAYPQVAKRIVERFSNVGRVAITLRQSVSADHNNWGAMLYQADTQQAWFAPLDADGRYQPYQIRDIVDRVGAGDSFAAGLLHGLNHPDNWSGEEAIRFAVAASCLKHSVHGDINYVTEAEVAALVAGQTAGRVQR